MIKMPNIIHITRADDLSISNNQLVMIDEDNNDEKNNISLNDISAIVIENCYCKISAILQLRLVENNIPIIFPIYINEIKEYVKYFYNKIFNY